MRHSFGGARVDMQIVENQAHGRMYDRYPESTVVHYHAAGVPCTKNSQHRLYDHGEGIIVNWLEGDEMPPVLRSPIAENKPSMADSWVKDGGS
jgi:hypothetical protein